MNNVTLCSSSSFSLSCWRAIVTALGCAFGVSVSAEDHALPPADAIKRELIEIMKTVNFVPQLGADEPFCKAFYEDFKKQANIVHIQPIVKAEKYDDPVFRPYQQNCPKLQMHKHYGFEPRDMQLGGPPESEEEAEARAREISTGLKNFQLFWIDINNNPKDGEEYLFYYEGEFEKRSNKAYPASRAYQVVDMVACQTTDGIYFNRGGRSEHLTRNGVIRYKGKNAIYMLESWDKERIYLYLTLELYSDKLKRLAPTCTYHKPR